MLCAAVLLGCGSKPQSSVSAQEAVRVEMTVKDYGTIVMEMDPVNAPITVENFVKLAESGFSGWCTDRNTEIKLLEGEG